MQWNLIRLRREMNLSQSDIAKLLNINVSTYQNKETGRSSFRDYEMFMLSNYFNKPMEEIFLPRNCTDNAIRCVENN